MSTGKGYASVAYAHTCAHLGTPRTLSRSGVTLLVRTLDLPFAAADACAPYPLLRTHDWRALAADLAATDDLLSFVGVIDPLATPAPGTLDAVFPEHLAGFKTHAVAHLDPRAPLAHVHPEHRRKARRAARRLALEVAADPASHAADWVRLYSGLRLRHGFRGAADFPPAALAAQLALPGMLAVLGRERGDVVSMSLWFVDGDVAHYHLGASDARGYAAQGSYGTFALAFETLAARGVEWVGLGGAAGDHDRADGLARFKHGWATGERTAWLGGRVLDRAGYARLAGGEHEHHYFPAYRARQAA
ncbi:MAG: GNAT family N-acetyltransferase [Candidatus Eisenbacteria bacterium]